MLHADALAQEEMPGPAEDNVGGHSDSTAWKLVFHDEFNASTLDPHKWATWFTYSDDGSDNCAGCRVMSGTNNIFRSEQVQLSDGHLVLGVEQEAGEWFGQRLDHAAGMIHTTGYHRFIHGRFEIRCRIPAVKGLWPAFWGFGGETEIDVFEFCGERPRWMKGALHRWGERKHSNTGKHRSTDLSEGFHTYALEWEDNEIRWYLDGALVHSRGRFVDRRGRPLPASDRAQGTHATAPYFPRANDALAVIVNLAVSEPRGYCKGPRHPEPWPEGTALVVDHVRVYQRTPQEGREDLCSAPRAMRALEQGPLQIGEELRFEVSGPHGDLEWSAAHGLEILANDASSMTVKANGHAEGLQWVRVESTNDPCPRGSLQLESGVEVFR